MKIGHAGSITVVTGNETAIQIKELQPSGKTKMTSEDFLRGAGSKSYDRDKTWRITMTSKKKNVRETTMDLLRND